MQKRIACINDISGIGKCSLTVALPIISALKCQCCPLPTSVLSSQTGYPKYSFVDLTDSMPDFIDTWGELKQNFDAIYSGFLGSSKQIKIVEDLINENPNSFVIVDPVLGDNGVLFPVFNAEDVYEMKKLITMADLITPNITEANLLLGNVIDDFNYSDKELLDICESLANLGPRYVVITGYEENSTINNICFDAYTKKFFKIGSQYNKVSFSGTGDIFTSIISALIVRNFTLEESVKIANDFIFESVNYTSQMEVYDRNDGILFEYFLDKLVKI